MPPNNMRLSTYATVSVNGIDIATILKRGPCALCKGLFLMVFYLIDIYVNKILNSRQR